MTTRTTDKDVAIHHHTTTRMTKDTERRRSRQRITQLLKKREEVDKQILAGKVTRKQGDKIMDTFDKELDAEEGGGLGEDAVLVGKDALPFKSNQITTTINPFTLHDSELEDLTIGVAKSNAVNGRVRIDKSLVIAIEDIEIAPNINYKAWSLTKITKEVEADLRAQVSQGKKPRRPFNFSGSVRNAFLLFTL